jgi:hypothetical protein
VTVHFDEVCDRFSPQNTTFSIADPKELKDTKLSAACSLHAASGSTSSSTSSLRRRRLMEIAEEEEEEERERKRQSVVKEDEHPRSPRALASEPPVKLDADLAKLPDASQFANGLEPPHFTGAPRPSSPTRSFDEASRRMSSQSSRTDTYPASSYPYLKPRVKLGPRPSADPGRPGSSAGSTTPRVSTVPAGLKSMSKGSKKGPHSQALEEEAPESPTQEQAEDTFPSIETEADNADAKPSETELAQPEEAGSETQAAADSAANMPPLAPPPTKQNTMTPEKARLLKAMKLREKKKLLSLQPTLDVPAADIPSAPSTPGLPDEGEKPATTENVASTEEAPTATEEPRDGLLAVSQPDSAIDVGTDHVSVDTPMDSHPASPLATSETGESTQASSLSDSTDETVLAKDEQPVPEGAEDETRDGEPAASTQSETVPPKEPVDEAEPALRDRQSQITITAATKDEGLENNVDEPAATVDSPAGDAAPETSQVSTSSDAPDTPCAPEKDTSDATSATTAEPAAPTPNAADAEPTNTTVAEDENAPSPQILIPTSKFSTQDSKSPIGAAPQDVPSTLATSDVDSWRVGESAPPVPEKDSVDAAGTAGTEPQKRKLPDPIQTDLHAPDNDKRRSAITIADNDGFMDELQSATVQQATPIMVSKSPMSPFFSVDQTSTRAAGGLDGTSDQRLSTRTVSNPVRNSYLGAGEAPAGPVRSASSGTAYLQKVAQQQADLRPKSAKLGSSISQRIKALEKLSSIAPGVEAVPSPKERPASAFFSVRKATTRESSRPPSVVGDRAGSVTGRASPAPPPSRDSSPETTRNMGRGRSGSVVNRMSMFEGGMAPRGRPDSVQVTARIVRDPNQPFSKGGLVEYGPLDLKQSPLSVDVQNHMDSQSLARPPSGMSVRTTDPREIAIQAQQSLLERRLSRQSQEVDRSSVKVEATHESRPRRRSSLSVMKDYIKDRTESIIGGKSPSTDNLGNSLSSAPGNLASPTASRPASRAPSVHQPGSLARHLSISSRRSSIEQSSPALSSAVLSPASAADGAADPESDKRSVHSNSGPGSPKSNRATRFMRRLSNTLVTSRKNTAPSISPTVAEENAAEVEAASSSSTTAGVAVQAPPKIDAFMGDVNVQFPDNLLWKRRSMCLDNQGFLILSSVQGTAMLPSGKDRHGALIKRYHMSDFKPPYAPDVELQELPNSVVLDIVNGSGLQIACEDRAGQMSILNSECFPFIDRGKKEQKLTNRAVLEEAHRNHSNFGQ